MNRNAYPLRKVVRRDLLKSDGPDNGIPVDLLECGHWLPLAQDIIGTRYPKARRCHKCAKGRPAEWEYTMAEDPK